jgi:hypothetical protein
MLGGDKLRGSVKGARAFVHFYDFASIADVGPRTSAAGTRYFRTRAGNQRGNQNEENNPPEVHIRLPEPKRR